MALQISRTSSSSITQTLHPPNNSPYPPPPAAPSPPQPLPYSLLLWVWLFWIPHVSGATQDLCKFILDAFYLLSCMISCTILLSIACSLSACLPLLARSISDPRWCAALSEAHTRGFPFYLWLSGIPRLVITAVLFLTIFSGRALLLFPVSRRKYKDAERWRWLIGCGPQAGGEWWYWNWNFSVQNWW